MSQMVTCLDTKQKVLKEQAYKPEGYNRYFSSKDAADRYFAERKRIAEADAQKRAERERIKRGQDEILANESEEEKRERKEWKDKCIDALGDILGYSKGYNLPSVFFVQLEKFSDVKSKYNFRMLYLTIKGESKTIKRIVETKTFANEYNMMSYVFAILKNKIENYYQYERGIQKMEEVSNQGVDGRMIHENTDAIENLIGDSWWA